MLTNKSLMILLNQISDVITYAGIWNVTTIGNEYKSKQEISRAKKNKVCPTLELNIYLVHINIHNYTCVYLEYANVCYGCCNRIGSLTAVPKERSTTIIPNY